MIKTNILRHFIKSDNTSKNSRDEATYVSVSSPLEIKRFKIFNAPTGWHRIDILKDKIKTDKNYRNKFSPEEINLIMNTF